MDSAIGFQVCNKGSVLMLFIDSVFKKYFIQVCDVQQWYGPSVVMCNR